MITFADIEKLNQECLELLSFTDYLRQDKDKIDAYSFTKKLFDSIRKLTIAYMLQNKTVICISGLQQKVFYIFRIFG